MPATPTCLPRHLAPTVSKLKVASATTEILSTRTAPRPSHTQHWPKELVRERLVRSGWLDKRGDKHRSRWKRRWFVLRGTLFAYYNDESEYSPLCIVNTLDIHSVTATSYSAKREHVLAVVTRKRTFYLDAAARVELEAWLQGFDEVMRSLPPSAPSLLSLCEPPPANPGLGHARRLSCPAQLSTLKDEKPAIPASVKSDLSRQFTHRAGWIWRYEKSSILGGKHWKRRWCVLRGDRFLVYKDEREYSPMRVIALHHVLDVLSAPMGKRLEKCLPAQTCQETKCFHMIAAGKTYQLAAESRDDLVAWVQDLRRLVAPFQIAIKPLPRLVTTTRSQSVKVLGRPVSAPAGQLDWLVLNGNFVVPPTDDDDSDEISDEDAQQQLPS